MAKFDIKKRYQALPVHVKASFWFLVCSVLQKGISTITMPIFTRISTNAEFGQFSVYNSWMGIISVFVTLNLFYGVYVQGLIKYENEKDAYSSSLQGLTLTLVGSWTLVYLLFHNFWNRIFSLTTVQMLAMMLMIWTSAVFSFWAAEQRVKLNYIQMVALILIVSVVRPAVAILFILHAKDKVTARIIGLVLVDVIAYTGLFFVQMRRGRVFYSKKFWKYAVRFNLPLIPHYLSSVVLSSADRIMIDRIVGASEAGIYSLAYSVSLLMSLFGAALSQTMEPWMYQKIKEKKTDEFPGIAYLTLMIVGGLNLLLIAAAPEIVTIFAPASYHDAIWVIPPIAMSVFFTYSYDLFAKFAFYYEKTKFIMAASVTASILNVILNDIFITRFGYYAAGYTTLVCYILYIFGHYYFMKRIINKYMGDITVYNGKKLIGISLGFMASGFILMELYRMPVLRYLVILSVCAVAFWKRKRLTEIINQLAQLKKKG